MRILITLFFLSCLSACGTNPSTEQANAEQESSPEQEPSLDTSTSSSNSEADTPEEASDLPENNGKVATLGDTLVGVYKAATVYAGSTDFLFTIAGEDQMFRISNEIYFRIQDGESIPNYKLPPDLLDPEEQLEGPPGANPQLVGTKYKILSRGNSLVLIPFE